MLDILLICVDADAELLGSALAEAILARHPGVGIVVTSPDADGVAAINGWLRRPTTPLEMAIVVFGGGEPHPKVLAGVDVVVWRNPPMLVILTPAARGADTSMISGSVPRLAFASPGDASALAQLDAYLREVASGGSLRFSPVQPSSSAPAPMAPAPPSASPSAPSSGGLLGGILGSLGGLLGSRRSPPSPASASPPAVPLGAPAPGALVSRESSNLDDLKLDELLGAANKDVVLSRDALRPPGQLPAKESVTGQDAPTPVQLGASAPRAAAPGDEFTARFAAYIESLESSVKATLLDLSPGSTPHLGIKPCQWVPGTAVEVTLRGKGLVIEPPSQAFTWDGAKCILDFDVSVPENARPGPIVLKFDAAVGGIVVASLRLDLRLTPAGAGEHAAGSPVGTASASAARTAFASYSSEDRQRVLDRVAAVRISAGLDVFLDCLSLHPGQEWLPRLEQEIKQRDVFLLFWSQAAAESRYVSWEWQTALRARGKGAMQIHPLEAGLRPPAELADLHFGDVYMLARKAGGPDS